MVRLRKPRARPRRCSRRPFTASVGPLLVLGLHLCPSDVVADVLATSPRHLVGSRMLARLLALWEDPASATPLRSLLSEAARDPNLVDVVGDYIASTVVAGFEHLVPGRWSRQRATVFAMVIAGLVYSRYVFQAAAFTALTVEEVQRFYAPVLQAALDGPLVPHVRPLPRP